MKKIYLTAAALAGAAVLLLAACGEAPQADAETPAETPASDTEAYQMPEFSTVDLNGETVTNDLFAEKDLTVLNVWGTFCGPCVAEMPELGEWEKELPENVQLVGLIIDIEGENDTEHHDAAVEITQKAGAEFRHLIANEDFAPFLEGVTGVPTTVFVDKEGKLAGGAILGAQVDKYKEFVEGFVGE
ncbi:TlpA family protein disulfide reductase [Butyricicoccus sp. 1XD8-22]|nr:TlpA family protein disulfide reductase [Butyricicoccus sp. 1XD8-22]